MDYNYLLAQIAEMIDKQNQAIFELTRIQAEMLELMKENKGDN